MASVVDRAGPALAATFFVVAVLVFAAGVADTDSKGDESEVFALCTGAQSFDPGSCKFGNAFYTAIAATLIAIFTSVLGLLARARKSIRQS